MNDPGQTDFEASRAAHSPLEPIYEELREELRRRRSGGDTDVVLNFARLFFAKAPPGFLEERSPRRLAELALSAFEFLGRSGPGRVDVEVENESPRTDAWSAPVTVIRTNVSERPFIVDTIREYLHAQGLSIEVYIYPVLQVDRDGRGRVEAVSHPSEGDSRESLVHCEVTRISDPSRLQHIRSELLRRLGDVVVATDDFQAMVGALKETVAVLVEMGDFVPDKIDEIREVQAFLRWLGDGAFVFLGYREYGVHEHGGERGISVVPGSGLGILRSEDESSFVKPVPISSLSEDLRELIDTGPLLIISKTNARSTVHRRARMDYIGVKVLDADGNVAGERRFVGLFTSKAYAEEAERIPILRRKLEWLLEDAGVQKGSHDYKEIHTIFNTLPKEELFLTSVEEIAGDVRTILTTYGSDEVRVTLREDPLRRGISAMAILPKEAFSSEVRKLIEDALVRELDGEVLNYRLTLGEGDQARLHFYLAASAERLQVVTPSHMEEIVRQITRSWTDRVREGLEEMRPPDEAARLIRTYADGFSSEYRAARGPANAVEDIQTLDEMRAEGRSVTVELRNPAAPSEMAGGEPVTELRLYLREDRMILSEFMPILEDFGLRVVAVTPYEVEARGVRKAFLYVFVVQDAERHPLDIEEIGSRLSAAILAVRKGRATNDPLNELVLTAGLAWREVEVLRTYASYAFQAGVVPSRLSLPVALRKHPPIAALLFELFTVRFDPSEARTKEERERETEAVRGEFREALEDVQLLSEDRALRALGNLILATLRTNYFRCGAEDATRHSGGVPYLSLKLDCQAVEASTPTRLRYEVWVRSSRMEGVHLRGARVARGGIRHSDRLDDFRTEVLGLVRTQMVKNAVIVPAGSKGGFVTLRQLPSDEMAGEVQEQYKTLIRGLLDLTDNLVEGEPVAPEGLICYDGADPYLVVAADKGTARFSDVANLVAEEYGFWLGDAFASGGSNGYDHKEVGITARGAWECVRRHFLEMNKDIQAEPFTVVGIGDMSGDVFGNGMLLSRQIRLIAAFDHRDIMIDPDPDPEVSFRERERLFALKRSSWRDYDSAALSKGAMIVSRGAKEVELTPEAIEALGIQEESAGTMDGESLVRHILQAPAELLWNGGIGTYVKASGESHAAVGDASNDPVRVDASQLRCTVVGEGGNLGLTQEARIEYALAGGRINTDAIDNSGGVDLSDREVNLKILLGLAMEAGHLLPERRNPLLRELSDPVSELVQMNNRSQSLAVSLDGLRAGERIDDLRDLMVGLERVGLLDRVSERLPTWELLAERQEHDQGFTRPELAILLGYSKLHLGKEILRSELPDDPAGRRYLRKYFPSGVLEEGGEEVLERHRLRREILASQLTNDLVDVMGAGFVHRVARDTGHPPARVAWAWVIASRLTGQRGLMESLRGFGTELSFSTAYRWLLGLGRVLERTTRWFLSNGDPGKTTEEVVEENMQGLARLREAFSEVVTGEDRRTFERLVGEVRADGAEEGFASGLISLRFLDHLLEMLRVSRRTGDDPLDVGRAFYQVAEIVRLPWLQRTVFAAAEGDRWDQRAAHALSEDLTWAHQRLLSSALALRVEGEPVHAGVERVARQNREALDRYTELVLELDGGELPSLPALAVVVRELMSLAQHLCEDRK